MKEFLEYLIKSIVSKPESVAIKESKEDTSFVYNVTVDQSDMGLIIGKEGRTIKSIREMAKAKAIKEGTRVDVILDEEQFNEE